MKDILRDSILNAIKKYKEETIHNRQFVHSSNIYKLDNYYDLSNAINQISNDKTLFSDRLNMQLRSANSVSIESFLNKMK